MSSKQFEKGNHITDKMKLNFLANILHDNFIFENGVLICELGMKDLLREYNKQVTANEMSNPLYDKKQVERLDFSKRTLRELTTNGYLIIEKGICKPTDKFWCQDEFKDFYMSFKEIFG